MWSSLLQKQEHLLALKVLTGSLLADVEKNKKQKPPSVGNVCTLQRRMSKDNFRALNLFDWPQRFCFPVTLTYLIIFSNGQYLCSSTNSFSGVWHIL